MASPHPQDGWRIPSKSCGFCERGRLVRRTNGATSNETIGRKSLTAQSCTHSTARALGSALVMALAVSLSAAFLLPVTLALLPTFIPVNLIQDEFADGPLMRHLIIEFELIRISFDPFINLFVSARIF